MLFLRKSQVTFFVFKKGKTSVAVACLYLQHVFCVQINRGRKSLSVHDEIVS